MKNAPTKSLIFIIFIAVITIIAASSFAFAYWSGSPEQEISGDSAATVDNDYDEHYVTTKYLVFEPIGTTVEADKYCFEYTDENGWVLKYQYGSDYILEGGAHNAGSRDAVSDNSEKTALASAMTAVKVIGYIGTLGQFEDLIIPHYIEWNSTTVPVTKIDIKMTEYKESMDLITGVIIPGAETIDEVAYTGVTQIIGVSFSGAGNLVKVEFKGINTTTIAASSGFIGDLCFRGMNSNIVYKNSAGATITNIRA